MQRALVTVVIGLILSMGSSSAAVAQADRSPAPTNATAVATGSRSKGNNYWGLLGLLGLLGLVRRNKHAHAVHPSKGRPAPRMAFSDTALFKLRATEARRLAAEAEADRRTKGWTHSVDTP